ncbi:MAG: 4-hydroxy-tetrahydrodipicolinate reductase [Flavobacteriaceae bacterium TMED212]|nr:MAG: 4-hydroxy-tetrahydrodipicolinate reductase [Flavobacteriaceae bacterium TMED212]
MRLALLGYGRMGKAIEKIALQRGHKIICKIDKNQSDGVLTGADVAINFSVPNAAVENINKALNLSIPVVCGTTGWLDAYEQVTQNAEKNETAFLYASNFSVGVNIFYKLNKILAQMMRHQNDYKVSMEEIHHVHKLDMPSGTSITLAEGIIENSEHTGWKLEGDDKDIVNIKSIRSGEFPGTHNIKYRSNIDEITIEHKAENREGFAIGAVIASEWIVGKKGIFKMDDVINL